MGGQVWPIGQPAVPAVVTTLYLIANCTLAVLISRRLVHWRNLRETSIARLLVLAVLIDSFIFVFASAILVLGIGTTINKISCQIGIWWCISLYATSKIFIYIFLMERVHLVYSHTEGGRISRFRSPWYRFATFLFVLWIGVAITMIVGRISDIRSDKACEIGLRLYSTVPMLTVDAIVNIFLTMAFVLPIYRSKFHKAQTLAKTSCIAAVAALCTSFANITILSIQHGHQLSWVCLGSCGLDVTTNAIIIFIVTSGERSKDNGSDMNMVPSIHRDSCFRSMNGAGTIRVVEEVSIKEDRNYDHEPGIHRPISNRRVSLKTLSDQTLAFKCHDLKEEDEEEEDHSSEGNSSEGVEVEGTTEVVLSLPRVSSRRPSCTMVEEEVEEKSHASKSDDGLPPV